MHCGTGSFGQRCGQGIAALVLSGFLVGCSSVGGFKPLYAQQTQAQVGVERVYVKNPEQAPGGRRSAQIVAQELARHFPEGRGVEYSLDIAITENLTSLAVRADATDQRLQLSLVGQINFYDTQGRMVHSSIATMRAPFNVDASPLSTETSRTNARETAARALANEIVRRVALFTSDGRDGR